MVAGRWLAVDEENALVISDSIWDEHPEFEVGDIMRIDIAGHRTEEWPVIGIYRFIDMEGDLLGYANYDQLAG